jgi:class 3 adenylate cyclase
MQFDSYRPELHYMRGPGPKWHAKHDHACGIAVHVAARVAALAEPSECLVTRTVRDLVAGADVSFSERGKRDLKGMADAIDLFAVTPGKI